MDIFRTVVEIPESKNKINHQTPVLLMGSCFTENIGNNLVELKFNTEVNPFGVLYNPISIQNSLQILINKRTFTNDDLFQYNDLWHSFYHHSKFSNTDVKSCLQKINSKIEASSAILTSANFLFITFGTAWVFEKSDTGQVVSNCHKLPAKLFTRYLLKVEEVTEAYSTLLEFIHRINPTLKVVITVSPIRHWKDGAESNQISKSTLLLIAAELERKYDFVEYFPAYEIVMDELRDYRFYADDMLHLNNMATDYVWKRFSQTYFCNDTLNLITRIDKIIKAKNHIPFNKNTESFTQFMQSHLSKTIDLANSYPFLNMQEEVNYFKSQLPN